jgi:hypothetical protein
MAATFVSKTQAISIISMETGFGRRVIEKMMDKLERQGRIKILDSPDGRALRIARTDVDIITQVLKGEIE